MHEWFECKFLKICLKVTKWNQTKESNKKFGAPVFAPDYSATGLAAKMWTNSQLAFYVYYISMILTYYLVRFSWLLPSPMDRIVRGLTSFTFYYDLKTLSREHWLKGRAKFSDHHVLTSFIEILCIKLYIFAFQVRMKRSAVFIEPFLAEALVLACPCQQGQSFFLCEINRETAHNYIACVTL